MGRETEEREECLHKSVRYWAYREKGSERKAEERFREALCGSKRAKSKLRRLDSPLITIQICIPFFWTL